MIELTSQHLPAPGVRSLEWRGEASVDWLEGGREYRLNGTIIEGSFKQYLTFDWVISSPDGQYQVVMNRTGRHAFLLKNGQSLRELKRAEYQADAYEYPIAFSRLPSGRMGLLHCPDRYNQLVVEEVESGLPLAPYDGLSDDYFLSRLNPTDDGRYLVTAGWFWHPWETVQVYDLAEGLDHPEHLHRVWNGQGPPLTGEPSGVAILGGHQLAIATSAEEPFEDEPAPEDLVAKMLGVFDLDSKSWISRVPLTEELGILHRFGPWLLSLYDHPKLVVPETGEVVQRWPELKSGTQKGSIIWPYCSPPIAIDEQNLRFALAAENFIQVIQVQP